GRGVAPDHPAGGAAPLAAPEELVLVVDRGDAPAGIGDPEHPVVDVQPVDVDVRGDLVRQPRHLAGQVVDVAVVAAGVEPTDVGDDALHPVRQPELLADPGVMGERRDQAGLVADHADLVVDEDAERRGTGGVTPQHRRALGRRARADDLPARDRTLLPLARDGRRVPLAYLLAELLRRRGPGLGHVAEGAGLDLPGIADPAV